MIIFKTILFILFLVIEIYKYIFFVYILLSFFPVDKDNPLVRFMANICEPLYANLLRVLPPLRISIFDFSPFYVFIFLYIVQYIINELINRL